MPRQSQTAQLAAITARYKAQAKKAKEDGFSEIEDGKYIARLIAGKIETTPAACKMQFEVLEGNFAGKKVSKRDGLDTDTNLYYFGRLMVRLGYDPEEATPDVADGIFKELVKDGLVCEINLVTKGDFQNCYVNKVIDDYEGSGTSGGTATDEEDEEEEVSFEEGTRVSWPGRGGSTSTGVISGFPDDESKATVKRDADGKEVSLSLEKLTILGDAEEDEEEEAEEEEEEEEETESAEEEEEVELQAGMRVELQWKGKPDAGEVTQVIDDERAKVRLDSSGKVATVNIENLTLLEEGTDAEEEEEEVSAPPVKRGPGRPKKDPTAAAKPASTPATTPKRGAAATTTAKPAPAAPATPVRRVARK